VFYGDKARVVSDTGVVGCCFEKNDFRIETGMMDRNRSTYLGLRVFQTSVGYTLFTHEFNPEHQMDISPPRLSIKLIKQFI